MVEISVDTERCVGAGQCVLSAPDVFDQDDDGIVTVLEANPDADQAAEVVQAERICPAQAITVREG
ncbi:ferredoxin [Saccharopolyspora erythraea]|uniref:ferredoxin n=1 Tax=Saccharopolyspora erythraea TaxID=1836 RepID=UPI001BAA9D13|nr:ferredoxin [Saccharopolyspora erythraea]QUH01928.1 ferredoxin [Saccharopolyspora erythraea]